MARHSHRCPTDIETQAEWLMATYSYVACLKKTGDLNKALGNLPSLGADLSSRSRMLRWREMRGSASVLSPSQKRRLTAPILMARPEGFEPPTPWFVARYSIQLSYGRARSAIISGTSWTVK